ncbi:glycylpeptide N-tetradecanoyltransferase [Bacidia gigantensis]|uniref:glycylpeptide N-tetradecanoyltransferase n=1 Tax=Bacidia gigantensis TaxID=2732470 RepID=UPI001D042B93|nr:glycylpeptide N-tetradecanoyltransferase [Bacidia gigantensis]KAG8533053.1 glycylpeptide N-tetradecanoyltransferase [Bacidia gigantensis]
MSEQSKLPDPAVNTEVLEETTQSEDINNDEEQPEQAGESAEDAADGAKAKKKQSKKARLKKALTKQDESKDASGSSFNPSTKLTTEMVEQLLEMNPSLKAEVAGMPKEKAADKLKNLDVASLLTGLSVSGKNQKDMASYKFWQTQPVPRFDETAQSDEGPIKRIDPDKVPKDPAPMLEGFEWVTMDLLDEKQNEEVYQLLTGHYVEDDDAQFRFNYSTSFFNWALKSPGWRKEWHVGVRATKSQKLVAFISGVPMQLRVRKNVLNTIEINFLCVHKKLRSKRLAPVLIQEITRRCYVLGIFQAIYTAGVVLPKPVSSCRYYHRSLDWLKLNEVGFSGLPTGSTKARQITRYHLPSATSTPGLRGMQAKDVSGVRDLLQRYLSRFEMAPNFDEDEISHWMLHDGKSAEQVVWSFVVDDPKTKKITDFVSFYILESQVINNTKHDTVRAAYLYYYATETAFEKEEQGLKERLNLLMNDALVLAKKFNFDVFNALTLLDNPLFLEQQKFGAGDGQLHYYLFNYRTPPIASGVNAGNAADPSKRGGVGVVMAYM